MSIEDEIIKMRERSGNVKSTDKLVSFLYELLRDHLPTSDVEVLVQSAQHGECTYTNGWLAKYAEDLANRLK